MINSIIELLVHDAVAQAVLIFSCVIALGLALGNIKIFNIRLGIAGVLFAGIFFGHFKAAVSPEIIAFTRELGLILFVYTVGVQVGPAFFDSFKSKGLVLNILAAFVVLLGAVITLLLSFWGGIPLAAAVGMFSGATTNTPSLGVAQQALKSISGITPEQLGMPGIGYAITYPFGILGIILVMLITRAIFRIDVHKESAHDHSSGAHNASSVSALDLRVDNNNLNGLTVKDIGLLLGRGVVISRVLHNDKIEVAREATKVHLGDSLRVVGSKEHLEKARIMIGTISFMERRGVDNKVEVRRIIVTQKSVAGQLLAGLDAQNNYGITVTRVVRGETEFSATPDVVLQFADTLVVVGEGECLDHFARDIGNSARELEHPMLIPIFIGISLGVVLGNIPIHIPGVPFPVKLGLAGGPLVVAIILSRLGRIGRIIWYMPTSANLILREVGITLFLACVGLKAGEHFVEVLLSGAGVYWMACGAVITFVPLLVMALFARLSLKIPYLSLCGTLAGSMTDPPALAFANSLSGGSNASSVAYATVYPLVMLLRIVAAQVMVLAFMQ